LIVINVECNLNVGFFLADDADSGEDYDSREIEGEGEEEEDSEDEQDGEDEMAVESGHEAEEEDNQSDEEDCEDEEDGREAQEEDNQSDEEDCEDEEDGREAQEEDNQSEAMQGEGHEEEGGEDEEDGGGGKDGSGEETREVVSELVEVKGGLLSSALLSSPESSRDSMHDSSEATTVFGNTPEEPKDCGGEAAEDVSFFRDLVQVIFEIERNVVAILRKLSYMLKKCN
jgi:hypothetical protein